MFRATNALLSGLNRHSKTLPVNKKNALARKERVQAVHDILRKYNTNPGKHNRLPKPRDWSTEELPTSKWSERDMKLYLEKVSNKDGKFFHWRTNKRTGKQ